MGTAAAADAWQGLARCPDRVGDLVIVHLGHIGGPCGRSGPWIYHLPLVTVLLGVLVLGERLTQGQGMAVAMAAGEVIVFTYGIGVAPSLAFALAVSLAPYMLIKKQLAAGVAVSVNSGVMLFLRDSGSPACACTWRGCERGLVRRGAACDVAAAPFGAKHR